MGLLSGRDSHDRLVSCFNFLDILGAMAFAVVRKQGSDHSRHALRKPDVRQYRKRSSGMNFGIDDRPLPSS